MGISRIRKQKIRTQFVSKNVSNSFVFQTRISVCSAAVLRSARVSVSKDPSPLSFSSSSLLAMFRLSRPTLFSGSAVTMRNTNFNKDFDLHFLHVQVLTSVNNHEYDF